MAPGQDDMLQEVEATAPTWAAGKNPTVKVQPLTLSPPASHPGKGISYSRSF